MGLVQVHKQLQRGLNLGIRREWFRVLISDIFNADNALFILSSNNTLQPSPKSFVNPGSESFSDPSNSLFRSPELLPFCWKNYRHGG